MKKLRGIWVWPWWTGPCFTPIILWCLGVGSLLGSFWAWGHPTLRSMGSMVGLTVTSKCIYAKGTALRQLLPVPPLLWWAPADPCLHRRFSNTRRWFWFLFSESWCTQGFVCVQALQAWNLCFPQTCGCLVIKSHCTSRSESLGIPSLFFWSLGWEAWLGIMNIHKQWETFPWHYCSPVCVSPTGQVRDLILSWLCPSYHLTVASSLPLDLGYLFW